MVIEPQDIYPLTLLALCSWREARGEAYTVKIAQQWSVRNRVMNPRWWGHTWSGVVLMPSQYSSFNRSDPNSALFPVETDPAWQDCMQIADQIYPTPPLLSDPTDGAVSYFDISIASNPPSWATDGSFIKTVELGRLIFYKLAS
jgi:hypothetical protein